MTNPVPAEELGVHVPGEVEQEEVEREDIAGLPSYDPGEIPLDDTLNGRMETRLPIVVAVRLVRSGIADGTREERTYTDNISAHGARLFSIQPWQIGEEVRVAPRNEDATNGSVVYCQALGDGRFAMGVKFHGGPIKWTAATRMADGSLGRALAKTTST
jgi:hypothetical protein